MPSLIQHNALALPVKRVLGAPTGAPEIILSLGGAFFCGPSNALDRVCAWHDLAKQHDARDVLSRVSPHARYSRLSTLLKELSAWGFNLNERIITTPFRSFDLSKSWQQLKGSRFSCKTTTPL